MKWSISWTSLTCFTKCWNMVVAVICPLISVITKWCLVAMTQIYWFYFSPKTYGAGVPQSCGYRAIFHFDLHLLQKRIFHLKSDSCHKKRMQWCTLACLTSLRPDFQGTILPRKVPGSWEAVCQFSNELETCPGCTPGLGLYFFILIIRMNLLGLKYLKKY